MRNKPHPYVFERSSAWTRSDSRPNYQQLELFPETVYTCTDGYASISSPPALRDAREEKNGAENICLARRLTFSSTYEMPKVAAYQDSIPEYLIPFYRLRSPHIGWQCDADTHSPGRVIASFDDEHDIWERLRIHGKNLEQVLERSYIMALN